MVNRFRAVISLAGVLVASSPVSLSAQTPRAYTAQDLGSFGGQHLVGTAINNHGEIAGYGHLPDGTMHAFRWTRSGGLEDLGTNGGTLSQALGINDNGDVVGLFSADSDYPHGFIAPRSGIMRGLRTSERNILQVSSITNDGQMAGVMLSVGEFSGVHAFRTLKDGTLQDLGFQRLSSMATDINNAGDAVGYELYSSLYAFKFSDTITECRYPPCGKINLGSFGGANSAALAINNSGVVVGWSETPTSGLPRAFRAQPGLSIEDLGTLGGAHASADAINDAGTIVGWSSGQYPMTAFVYTDADGMVDLNARVPASEGSGVMYHAVAINDVGQIVVLYRGELGTGTVLLTPMVDTEPPTITSVSVSRTVLQPPDGRLVPVIVSVSATDNMDPSPVCGIVKVVNSEANSSTTSDIELTGAFTVSLRASRLGSGDGRAYTIAVRCSDDSGNASTSDVSVLVPHDNR